MRGYPVWFVGLWLAVLGVSAATAGTPLRVRPVAPPEAAARLSATERQRRSPITPEIQRAQAERARRWHALRHDLTQPGFNRSALASRRRGWTPPRWVRHGLSPEDVARPGAIEPDTIRVAFIRIDFLTDRGGSLSTGNGRFDLSGPDTLAPPIDRPPHNRRFYLDHLEALRRYYENQSYGLRVIEGDVWPRSQNGAYSLSDMADLGPWSFSQDILPAAIHMFRTTLFAADSQSIALGDRIPWDDYDRLVIIHAGGDFQSDIRQDSPEDIPSFTLGVVDSEVVVFPDSLNRPIDRATFVPETNNQDGYYGAINGVLAHECGHLLFGFFDVYNIDTGFPVVGFWSLMDYGNGLGSIVQMPDGNDIYATGFLPPSIDPWHRFRFLLDDMIDFPEVAYGDTMALERSERHPDLRRVSLTSDEYLLLENRYLALTDSVVLDSDDTTRVVLGPELPDRFEYDALLPGPGILVWHVDESVVALEYAFPIDTALRANPDFGLNSNAFRPGLSIIEADGLDDLGDLGSPYLLGAPFDPYFVGNNTSLSDTTEPNLIPHIRTVPHIRLDFLDEPDSTMRFSAARVWQLPGWPIHADFPPGGPMLLAVDADGDRDLEVCWAGGQAELADSAALFAVRASGQGLAGPDLAFAHLDRRPRPVMAALPTGVVLGERYGPSLFAVSTYADGPDTSTAGGRVWLLDHQGVAQPGWPAVLPSIVTTPPMIGGEYPNATIYVGCANGRVYALGLDGTVLAASDPPLSGGIGGRLAVYFPATGSGLLAAAGRDGQVGVFDLDAGLTAHDGWPQPVGGAEFEPDFLWIDFGGAPNPEQDCFRGALTLVIHRANRLWAYCAGGEPLPGWGRALDDTLVSGLGAGDPDGDGFPEVLTQSQTSKVAFWNLSGHPSPGWPKPGSREEFRTDSPPLALDLDGDGRSEVVAMNASGIVAALRLDGKAPQGWPLASGLGATGAPVVADLDRNGTIELVAPDRFGLLYGHSIPAPVSPGGGPVVWSMLGGDAGRTSALSPDATAAAPAPAAGPLVRGSLKAFPNPARRRPVSFSYVLTEPADVEFRIVDTSGHQVASFARRGRQADNLEVWDPGSLPAGLYMARIRFRSASREQIEVVPVGLLR